jgi:hypothetical protein
MTEVVATEPLRVPTQKLLQIITNADGTFTIQHGEDVSQELNWHEMLGDIALITSGGKPRYVWTVDQHVASILRWRGSR